MFQKIQLSLFKKAVEAKRTGLKLKSMKLTYIEGEEDVSADCISEDNLPLTMESILSTNNRSLLMQMATEKIKDFQTLLLTEITLNFEDWSISSDVWYINKNNEKSFINIKSLN